jgi:hypothetical protein
MKKITPILASLTATFFIGFLVAHAQADPSSGSYTPLQPLPLGTGGALLQTYTISTYLAGAMKLLIALGVGFSVVVAIIGGTQYVAAGASPSAKSGAKERIINAFVGLALILTSYLILNSLNPDLVNFKLDLPPVGQVPTILTTPTGASCASMAPLTPLSGDALIMEGGATVLFSSTDPNIQKNLTKLQAEVGKLQEALRKVGGSATVNSAYRPLAYQNHFYEINNRWNTLGLKDNTDPGCADFKAQVGAEYSKHGLNGVVASPNSCAPHVKGVGVDITVSNYSLSSINTFMQNNGIDLTWAALSNDPVHFNLKNPPYSGCAN